MRDDYRRPDGVWCRLDSGAYECYTTTPMRPTQEELDRHKSSYNQSSAELRIRGLHSLCLLCKVHFDIPTTFASVRATGMCPHCVAFTEGKLSSVRMWRLPTFEEAYNAPDKRHYDTVVILDAYDTLLVSYKALQEKLNVEATADK